MVVPANAVKRERRESYISIELAAVGQRGKRALATDRIARRVCKNAARAAVARVAVVEEKRETVLSRRSLVAALASDALYSI